MRIYNQTPVLVIILRYVGSGKALIVLLSPHEDEKIVDFSYDRGIIFT